MEIPFAADHTAVKKNGISMLLVQYILWYFMEFDVRSEVSFSSTESVDRFLSYCEPYMYMVNSIWNLLSLDGFDSSNSASVFSSLFLLVCLVSDHWQLPPFKNS